MPTINILGTLGGTKDKTTLAQKIKESASKVKEMKVRPENFLIYFTEVGPGSDEGVTAQVLGLYPDKERTSEVIQRFNTAIGEEIRKHVSGVGLTKKIEVFESFQRERGSDYYWKKES